MLRCESTVPYLSLSLFWLRIRHAFWQSQRSSFGIDQRKNQINISYLSYRNNREVFIQINYSVIYGHSQSKKNKIVSDVPISHLGRFSSINLHKCSLCDMFIRSVRKDAGNSRVEHVKIHSTSVNRENWIKLEKNQMRLISSSKWCVTNWTTGNDQTEL